MPSHTSATTESQRRRQPVQARAQRTLQAIVQAAAQILVKEGEAALTTNRIAERAGVSIGTLYQYFPDKQAVFRAMRSEEHTSELQSQSNLVCRLLLEKKNY